MKTRIVVAATIIGAGLAISAPAFAQHAPDGYDKCYNSVNGIAVAPGARSCAGTVVNANQSAGSSHIGNGFTAPTDYAQGNAVNTTSSTYDGWANASSTSAGNSWVSASSSLADGTLHSYAVTGSDGQGFGLARISDIVTFNNVSGGALNLGIGYTYDGQFVGGGGSAFDNATVIFAFSSPTSNITFANSGLGANFTEQTNVSADGQFYHQRFVQDADDVTFSEFGTPGNGAFGGAASTILSIPTGISQFGFVLTLDNECRVANSVCDFANTSGVSFGKLPTGLTFTSDSGVLFSALSGSAVPEPAAWLMMLAGFGMVGAATRYGRRGLKVART